jgi:hypothetical protein
MPRRRYAWSDVLEVSWIGGTRLMSASLSGPMLRTRGGAYDEPGPNHPARVGSIPIYGRPANEEAAELLRVAAEQHGIPFTPDQTRLVNTGKRPGRQPTDGLRPV